MQLLLFLFLSQSVSGLPVSGVSDKLLAKVFKNATQGRDIGLSRLQENQYWGDHALYLGIVLDTNKAVKALENKQYKTTILYSLKARRQILALYEHFPSSSFLKKTQDLLVRTEWAEGLAQLRSKNTAAGIKNLERAFFRSGLSLVRKEWMAEYLVAALQVKVATPFTKLWVWELMPHVKKRLQSDSSFKFQEKYFDQLKAHYPSDDSSGQLVPVSPRFTVTYKAIEPDLAAFDAAYALYQGKSYSKAIKALNALLEEYPKSGQRFRARFWLAQSYSQEQEHEKAKAEYDTILKESPLSYYGTLASQMGASPLQLPLNAPDSTLPVQAPPSLPPADAFRFHRAQKLLEINIPELAATDLREIRARDGIPSSFLMHLAELNSKTGNFGTSFGLLTELLQRSYSEVISPKGAQLIFPRPYMEVVEKQAKAQGLDPLLVLSLIKQESAFDAQIGSHVGATGLMQLMPTTALDVESNLDLADLMNPSDNVRVGTKYLARMLGKFNGNIAFALAAYNAGPSAMDRWIREKRTEGGLLEFVEQIPYKETQGYVGSIIRNYYWYSHLAGKPLPQLSFFWNSIPTLEPSK